MYRPVSQTFIEVSKVRFVNSKTDISSPAVLMTIFFYLILVFHIIYFILIINWRKLEEHKKVH
jgi:hypothetical protein